MKEQNLTVQEAVDLLLMSQSSVYSWIEKGKLKTIDSPYGKLIVISNKEIENIRTLNLKSRRNKVSKQSQQHSNNLQESPIIEAEYSKNDEVLLSSIKSSQQTRDFSEIQNNFQEINNPENQRYEQFSGIDVNLYLVKQLEKYALDAGQFKQLELIRKQEKDDLEHWKNEYFALKSEYIGLLARFEALEAKQDTIIEAKDIEISALKKQIDALISQNPSKQRGLTQNKNNPENYTEHDSEIQQNQSSSGKNASIGQIIKNFFTSS